MGVDHKHRSAQLRVAERGNEELGFPRRLIYRVTDGSALL
jgi:hypothetical protein